MSALRSLLSGAMLSGTPLLYATLSELISERAGIVNLGLEGVMLVGAVVGFIATVQTGSVTVGVVAAALAGGVFNLLFAFLVVRRRANQLATGLALMFAGVGLSALLGARYVGSRIEGLTELRIPVLVDLPVVGGAVRPGPARLRGRAAGGGRLVGAVPHTLGPRPPGGGRESGGGLRGGQGPSRRAVSRAVRGRDARRPRGRAPVAGRGADMGGVDDGGARASSRWRS